jgi:DNA mismatch repair ATPase MutL
MRMVVSALWGAQQRAVCPHGRPTHRRVTREEIARWFGRTGWRRD